MARTKKPSGNEQLKTGDQFLQKAREAGANVSGADKRGFHKISTPSGDMYMTGGKQPLDFRTRKNYAHWFKLLGLLVLLLVTHPIWLPLAKVILEGLTRTVS